MEDVDAVAVRLLDAATHVGLLDVQTSGLDAHLGRLVVGGDVDLPDGGDVLDNVPASATLVSLETATSYGVVVIVMSCKVLFLVRRTPLAPMPAHTAAHPRQLGFEELTWTVRVSVVQLIFSVPALTAIGGAAGLPGDRHLGSVLVLDLAGP